MSARAPAAARAMPVGHAREPAVRRRVRVRVQGTVQGVGFRPYVYRLARELGLGGYVLNDTHGVLLEVEGAAAAVECFLERLAPDAPVLAAIERVEVGALELAGESAFAIRASPSAGSIDTPVTPDSATCQDCLSELFDPHDRRYRYPFINCTNCGPRFTIVRGVPYDRPLTTMAGFQMCTRCRAEYTDPVNRRFHAQPNACPECGPSLALLAPDGTPIQLPAGTDTAAGIDTTTVIDIAAGISTAAPTRTDTAAGTDTTAAAAAALRQGQIVAIKGVGGFHLACRADDESAVATLRARKRREDKPFALMLADVPAASRVVVLGSLEREMLCGPERPIVLAPRRAGADVAPSVAPGAPELGVMLPYSPLHHLLLADLGEETPLVMTSGNVSTEPIAFGNEDAIDRLGAIADLLLVHNRPIQTRTDDSVVRAVDAPGRRRRITLRRSRGYVPASLSLPDACERPILACGAELKSTFCLARGSRAWVSHHIGDLENYETLRSFTDGIAHFKRLFALEPEVVAYDLHPDYLSTKYAIELDDAEQLIGVQHHHAHLAAVLAEHREHGPALGAIFDGTGYGLDGTVWGGELLLGDLDRFERVGSLVPVRLPGGSRAIWQPWRMACAWLAAGGDKASVPAIPSTLAGEVTPLMWEQVARLSHSTSALAPVTTSVGRLFDAVSALCGIRARVNFEGQAAVELEAACDPRERGCYPIAVRHDTHGTITIDPRATIAAILTDVNARERPGAIASRFHAAMASATIEALLMAARAYDCPLIVLAGGVFQNRRLLQDVMRGAEGAGLRVLVPEQLPLGDGAISFGQAAIAARPLTGRQASLPLAPDQRHKPGTSGMSLGLAA
jgi:hydrogenase maturation protein HypF